MFRFGFVWRLLFALLVIGVLVAGGTALFRAGWAQGYQVGALATAPGGSGNAPALPYYYPPYAFYPPFGFHPFGLFGLVFGFFLIFFLFGGLFRFLGWRHWAGHTGYGDWSQGSVPPWAKEWHERHHPQPEKGESTNEETAESR
jgi:hypothetical protein